MSDDRGSYHVYTRAFDIELLALGIGFDVARFYAASTTIKTAEDLGAGLLQLLEHALSTRPDKQICQA